MDATEVFSAIASECHRQIDRDLKTLEEVAKRNPTLFAAVAKQFLQAGTQSRPPARRASSARRNDEQYLKIVAVFSDVPGHRLSIKEIMEATRLSRSAVRYVIEKSHKDQFRITDERRGRAELWEVVNDAGPENQEHAGGLLSPTKAVLSWLEKHPNGGTVRDMTDDLGPVLQTNSPNKLGVLSATLSNLTQIGKLRSQGDNGSKRFYLAEEPAEVE